MPTAKRKKASRKKPETPRSIIRSALRLIWLRSRERKATLNRSGYCCEQCGAKNSKAKGREVIVEVHHAEHEPNWERIFSVIYEELLQPSERLMALCIPCHDKEHEQHGQNN